MGDPDDRPALKVPPGLYETEMEIYAMVVDIIRGGGSLGTVPPLRYRQPRPKRKWKSTPGRLPLNHIPEPPGRDATANAAVVWKKKKV